MIEKLSGWQLASAWFEVWLAGVLFIAGLAALALALSALINSAFAAPFLICDPYPASAPASAVPTEFVVTISGVTAPITTPAVDVTGGKAMKLDLGPLSLSGTRTITAKAKNVWGESAASAPFVFTAGAPVTPTGFGLSAQ